MKQLTVGIQGGKGSFNEAAAKLWQQLVGVKEMKIMELWQSRSVVEAVMRGRVDVGVMAVYNSIGGEVEETGRWWEEELEVGLVWRMPIRHYLFKLPEVEKEELEVVMSHPQALKQCQKNLQQRWPSLVWKVGEGEWRGTAGAARALVEGLVSTKTAVLGSWRLGEVYGLEMIDERLEDRDDNWTWFVAVESPLKRWRKEIDRIDRELVKWLGRRKSIVKAVGKYKKDWDIQVVDIKRFEEMMVVRKCWGQEWGLTAEEIENWWRRLHDWSISLQVD